MNNLLSYSRLVDAKIGASDKDLPVLLIKNYLKPGQTMMKIQSDTE